MKLLPSLKQKKRYLVFEIISETKFSVLEIQEAVNQALKEFFGQLGLTKASPLFLKEKTKNNKFVIKISHKFVDEGKSALILIKKIKNKPVIIRSIITSGTLKKASTHL